MKTKPKLNWEHDPTFVKCAVGDTVAYNCSGAVLLGKVIKLKPQRKPWLSSLFVYRANAVIENLETGWTSTVMNADGILNVSDLLKQKKD